MKKVFKGNTNEGKKQQQMVKSKDNKSHQKKMSEIFEKSSKKSKYFLPAKQQKFQEQKYISQFPFQRRDQFCYPKPIDLSNRIVTNTIRMILFDWMVLVCSEHNLLRQTCALSRQYIDLYLLKKPQLKKQQLQLFGFSCISIAAKVQQSKIMLSNLYSKQHVRKTEIIILQQLDYLVNPDTIIYWINYLMSSWDNYVQLTLKQFTNTQYLLKNSTSFILSRQIYDICDAINFDVNSTLISKEQLVTNIFYVMTKITVLSLDYKINPQMFQQTLIQKDQFLLQFSKFAHSIGIAFALNQKLICYIARFLKLQIDYTKPTKITKSWQQFICIQTLNKKTHQFVSKLIKQ